MKNGKRVNNSKVKNKFLFLNFSISEIKNRNKESGIKNIVGFLLVLGLILPSFGSINSPQVVFAQNQAENLAGPEKVDLTEILEKTRQAFPGALKNVWKEELLPVLEKYYQWIKVNIWSPAKSWFEKTLKPKAKGEREKRKPIIEEELKKEKEELKGELPKVGKSLWERFKELIK